VAYSTLRVEGDLEETRRTTVEDALRRVGGSVVWQTNARARRTYALLEAPDGSDFAALAASGATLYDRPVIALAVFPALAEALPGLLEALGGAGRPVGVLACDARADGAIVEWDPAVSDVRVVLGLIDLELARLRGGRIVEVLAPMPGALVAMVAAQGLEAPQISAQRVLEFRIDRA
jgi:hypothetical protein